MRDYLEKQVKLIEDKIKAEFSWFKGGPGPGQVQEYQYYKGKQEAYIEIITKIDEIK